MPLRPLGGYRFALQVQPYFALPWILTWFSHSLADVAVVSRMFDLFLVSHPLLPLYASAAVRAERAPLVF